MRKFIPYLLVVVLLMATASPGSSQEVVYEEHFTDGTASLNWFSAWNDSLGNPLTPMVATNETGPSDDWIGVVTGDLETLGSLGSALAGEPTLADYSIEAQVYVELGGGFYNGIMMRVDTTDGNVVGYQLLANFNAMLGAQRLRFRYFSQFREEIRTLAEIQANDLPGGAPTEDGWHKMKITAIGNQFWLYWDDQELPGCPYSDDALSQGYFGVYVWDAMSGIAPTVKVDDIIVRSEKYIFEAMEEHFTDGVATFNWFSAWNDSLGNPLTPMAPTNETGPSDDWIGVVTGDLETLGSLGAALAGNPLMADYSIEAQVYVELNAGFYNGIMIRADTTGGDVVGYQFVANFNTAFGMQRLRFRYFSQYRENIRVIADIQAADLPGGPPNEDGWHKMKIKAVDNQFWLYWDDQEIEGSPFVDDSLSQGYFGVYTWDAMSGVAPTTKVDDIFIIPEPVNSVKQIRDYLTDQSEQFRLLANYPNPFNPETNISYQIKSNGYVDLTIFDLLGRTIKKLVSETQLPGVYNVRWDGTNSSGVRMPSGTYLYTLKTNGFSETKKMILVK